jgi:hypothetical protein
MEAPGTSPSAASVVEPTPVPRAAPTEREVRVVTSPAADLWSPDGEHLGRTPLAVRVTPGRSETYLARADGFRDTAVAVGWDSPREVAVTLAEAAQGKVVFRYFPANATVVVDDRQREARGNVVDLELNAGDHSLLLLHPDGSTLLKRAFVVQAGQTTNLGTLKEEP